MLLDKIKQHKQNEIHREAEEIEKATSSRAQPNWNETRSKEISKQQQAIQTLMYTCIFLCRRFLPLNILEELCSLFERIGVQNLPSATSAISYRNNDAALTFVQHISGYLHEELIEKIKASPVVGSSNSPSLNRCLS